MLAAALPEATASRTTVIVDDCPRLGLRNAAPFGKCERFGRITEQQRR
jgi:hypothetical protein